MSERPGSPRDEKLTREERLAAKLRENLRRRKAQARESGRAAKEGDGGLPKTPADR